MVIVISCHWKKEQVEEIELRNNLKDFHASLSKSNGESTQSNNDLEWKQQDVKSGEKKSEIWGTLDVLGRSNLNQYVHTIDVITDFHFMDQVGADVNILTTRRSEYL